ncbi:hypothetical protein MCHI_001367 [Candidatus Magnetoovum chiemensis]|nr:hypothetical protein MCHI_001367 [Candidatus Magnetoovum chiemensis]
MSSSFTSSSKVKPYWKPEQPPPCTNTRSFRLGLPSSLIRSRTLAAAESVKTNTLGCSVVTSILSCLFAGITCLKPRPACLASLLRSHGARYRLRPHLDASPMPYILRHPRHLRKGAAPEADWLQSDLQSDH